MSSLEIMLAKISVSQISTYEKKSGKRAIHNTGIIPHTEIIPCDMCMHIHAYTCACAYYAVKRKQKIQAEECISYILVLTDKNFRIFMVVVFKNRKRQTK